MSSIHHKDVARRAGVVGFFTLISRVFGLIRDSVLARYLGAGMAADAFYVAFRIPNLLRRLLAEGAMTVSFVPVFTDYLNRSEEEGKRVSDTVFTLLTIILTVLVIAGIALAPWLVRLIAYGFDEPAKLAMTVSLTRMMFPYIMLVSLMALAMGVLNTRKHFAAPAASPICLNIGIIAGVAVFSMMHVPVATAAALGVLVGGVAQLALQLPFVWREGFWPRIRFDFKHEAVRRITRLFVPSIFGAAVYQFNVLVVTFLASFLPHGSVTYLWFADRLNEFPLGVFSVAIATATLPTLSEHISKKDIKAFEHTMLYGLRISFLGTIPAAVGLWMLAMPIVSLLFKRGAFDAAAALATAQAVQCYVLGIPFISATRNIVPGFYALGDSKSPVRVSMMAMVVNAGVAVILMKSLLHLGLALAVAISATFNFILLFIILKRKLGTMACGPLYRSIATSLGAAIVMGVVIGAMQRGFGALTPSCWSLAIEVASSVVVGAGVYMLVLYVMHRNDFHDLIAVIRRRR